MADNLLDILVINVGSARDRLAKWYQALPAIQPILNFGLCEATPEAVQQILQQRGNPSSVIINIDGINPDSGQVIAVLDELYKVLDGSNFILRGVSPTEVDSKDKNKWRTQSVAKCYCLTSDTDLALLSSEVISKALTNREQAKLTMQLQSAAKAGPIDLDAAFARDWDSEARAAENRRKELGSGPKPQQ